MTIPVEQFARQERFEYPGKRYQGNYLIIGDTLHDLPSDPLEAASDLIGILENRIPVVAYGLNPNPHEARKKVTKYASGEMNDDDLSFIPAFKGTLKGHDVVWHGGPGQTANYFSELVSTQDNQDNETGVWVQYLTDEQLAQIHATEGKSYGLKMAEVSLSDGVTVNALVYVPLDSTVLLDKNGQMIGVPNVERSHPKLEVMTERQALEYTLGNGAVATAVGTNNLDKYAGKVDKLKKRGKLTEQKELQSLIVGAMRANDMIADYSYPDDDDLLTRTGFDSYPRGFYGIVPEQPQAIQLLEQKLANIRPSRKVIDDKVDQLKSRLNVEDNERDKRKRAYNLLDPVANVRRHEAFIGTERHGEQLRKWAIKHSVKSPTEV